MMTIAVPLVGNTKLSRMQTRHWNTLDSLSLNALSKKNTNNMMKSVKRTLRKFVPKMQSKQPRKRRNVKKKRRKIKKSNSNVKRIKGRKTIVKKDYWANYRAQEAILRRQRLSQDSSSKLKQTNNRRLRVNNRPMKNLKKLRNKKRKPKRKRLKVLIQKNNTSHVSKKNWTVSNYQMMAHKLSQHQNSMINQNQSSNLRSKH